MRQKKALAAMLVCAPCCSGSGGGSGTSCEGIATNCCCFHCGPARATDPNDVAGFSGPTSLTVSIDIACVGLRTVVCNLDFCGCEDLLDAECPDDDGPGTGRDLIEWSGTSDDSIAGTCDHCDGMSPPVVWPSAPLITATVRCKYTVVTGRRFEIDFAVYSATGNAFGTSIPLHINSCSPFDADAISDVAGGDVGIQCTPGGANIPTTSCDACVGEDYSIVVTE